MKKRQNMLDEMQENKLMKIEGAGFWLAFAGLLAAIIIQVLVYPNLRQIAGELTVFFIMSIYLIVLCLKNGLWSRTPPVPTVKGNAISSAVAALAIGMILIARSLLILRNGLSKEFFAVTLFLSMAVVFGGCFATLEVTRVVYRRRRRQLDDGDGKSEEA